MGEDTYYLVTAYDATDDDMAIIRSWLGLPNLVKTAGKLCIRFFNETHRPDYCEMLRMLHIRYDYRGEKKK